MKFYGILFILASALGSSVSHASIYPARGNTEIHYLPDYPIDQDVKIARINAAQVSIDFVTFSQTNDAMGRQFLKAIRNAQKRGVKVRMIYDRLFSMMEGDWANEVRTIVTDTELGCPGEIACPHPLKKTSRGLSINDYIHEKILLIDADTPNEIAFIGGRGFTALHSQFLDSGYTIRRMNPGHAYLGDDLKTVFDRLWRAARKVSIQGAPRVSVPGTDTAATMDLVTPSPFSKTMPELMTVRMFLNSLSKPANRPALPNEAISKYRFTIPDAQLLSNDLYEQLTSGISPDAVKNDIQRQLIQDIDHATGTLEITSYSFGPTDALLNAMARFVNRGNTLKIYSNSGDNFKKFSPIPAQTPIYYSYERMVALYDLTKNSRGRIFVYLQNISKAEALGQKVYIHRKLALLTGPRQNITYIGSDNLTWSAAHRNDEIMSRIDDQRFAEFHRNQNRSELYLYYFYPEGLIRKLYEERGILYKLGRNYIRNMF